LKLAYRRTRKEKRNFWTAGISDSGKWGGSDFNNYFKFFFPAHQKEIRVRNLDILFKNSELCSIDPSFIFVKAQSLVSI